MTNHDQKNLTGITARDVVSRIKEIEGLRFDVDITAILNVQRTRIGVWITRNTIPYEKLVKYSRDSGVSLDWLLLGRGSKYASDVNAKSCGEWQPQIINTEVFLSITQMVDAVLGMMDVQISMEKRDRIAIFIYRWCAEFKDQKSSPADVSGVSITGIRDLVKLAA